jgi:hypothetical protein
MSIVLQGSTSGSVTLQEPAVAGTTVLTLPAVSGTVITTGTTGQVIDSGALPIGSVLQVVNATSGTTTSSSTASYVTTGLSASITPKFATSKILIICNTSARNSSSTVSSAWTIFRGTVSGTDLSGGLAWGMCQLYSTGGDVRGTVSLNYLDSPATTSSTTYTMAMNATNVSNTVFAQSGGPSLASMTLMEIAG